MRRIIDFDQAAPGQLREELTKVVFGDVARDFVVQDDAIDDLGDAPWRLQQVPDQRADVGEAEVLSSFHIENNDLSPEHGGELPIGRSDDAGVLADVWHPFIIASAPDARCSATMRRA